MISDSAIGSDPTASNPTGLGPRLAVRLVSISTAKVVHAGES